MNLECAISIVMISNNNDTSFVLTNFSHRFKTLFAEARGSYALQSLVEKVEV